DDHGDALLCGVRAVGQRELEPDVFPRRWCDGRGRAGGWRRLWARWLCRRRRCPRRWRRLGGPRLRDRQGSRRLRRLLRENRRDAKCGRRNKTRESTHTVLSETPNLGLGLGAWAFSISVLVFANN